MSSRVVTWSGLKRFDGIQTSMEFDTVYTEI